MVGLLGGTFDPIHCGHLDVARAARKALGLQAVWLVPARVPPHRALPHASAAHRFAMAALAAAEDSFLRVSDAEMDVDGPSYTIDTLGRLERQGLSPDDVCFITGADAFREIGSWKSHEELLSRCGFVVVSRPSLSALALPGLMPGLAARMSTGGMAERYPSITLVDAITPDVSSTGVREAIRDGRPLANLVLPVVEAHILRHGLYRSPQIAC